jgi:hypothetical protein
MKMDILIFCVSLEPLCVLPSMHVCKHKQMGNLLIEHLLEHKSDNNNIKSENSLLVLPFRKG